MTKDHLELTTELLEKLDEHWKLAPSIGSKLALSEAVRQSRSRRVGMSNNKKEA